MQRFYDDAVRYHAARMEYVNAATARVTTPRDFADLLGRGEASDFREVVSPEQLRKDADLIEKTIGPVSDSYPRDAEHGKTMEALSEQLRRLRGEGG